MQQDYTGTCSQTQYTRKIFSMTSRRLLSLAASASLAAAGIIAPVALPFSSPASASPVTAVSTIAPAPTVATTAQMNTPTASLTVPTKRRIRIRSHSNNPVITIISIVLAILIVGGGILVRYAIFKATQRNSTPTTTFNGPNGPQYGVTGASYGTANYPQAGAPQPGSQVYGTGTYGSQQSGYPSSSAQGGQGPYGTGY